jgi:YD repeat-containing protein
MSHQLPFQGIHVHVMKLLDEFLLTLHIEIGGWRIPHALREGCGFSYDAFDRVTKTNFPSSLSETYQYDADDNLTQKTDRKGQTIQYLYDALNRLTQKTYPESTMVDYTYDLVDKALVGWPGLVVELGLPCPLVSGLSMRLKSRLVGR